MQLGVELLRGNRRRPGRGHDDRLEHAVAVGIVLVAKTGRIVAAKCRHRMPRPHQLLVNPDVAAAKDVLGITGQQVREPEARSNLGAVLPDEIPQRVVAADEVDTQPDRRRQA